MFSTTIEDPRKIERVALTHVNDFEAQMRGDVLTRANKLFGYTADSFAASGPLAKMLANLDIRPLRAEQVQDYMRGKERVVRFNTVWIAAFAAVVVPALWAVIMSPLFLGWFVPNDWHYTVAIIGQVLLGFAGLVGLIGCILEVDASLFLIYERESKWVVYSLGTPTGMRMERYARYVPLHVLNLAVQLREVEPNTIFNVYELTTVTRKLKRPDPDPFLEVVLGAERYFIAVWDEREYEAKA